jgi:hypothetical protein
MFKPITPSDDTIAHRILAILGDRTVPYEELFAQLPYLARDERRFGRILARMEEYPLIFIERRADGTRHVRRPRPLTGYAVDCSQAKPGAVA